MSDILFEPYNLGEIKLKNRIIMAPLTRCRAIHNNLPNDWMVEYYKQRASAGLIITEGSSPSPNGLGYTNIPGCFNAQHVEGWKKVTDAVHEKNGKIFFQMMHTGRIAHSDNLPEGGEVIGASAIPQKGQISTYNLDKQDYPTPKALTTDEVKSTIQEFVESAKMCREAGFDGVEIHSAHGYLPNQFINTASNQRTDEYGESIENRCRFLLEITTQMAEAIGPNQVGIRISPYSYADTEESPEILDKTYLYLVEEINKRNIAYLHLSHMGEADERKFRLWEEIRNLYNGTIILCGDFTKEAAVKTLNEDQADLVAFGRDYIGNPDLVERFKYGYPLAERNREKWYGQSEVGYTDYPFYQETV